jgi:arylsulfatase A-like enzyme
MSAKPNNILVLMGDHHRHDAMGWTGNPVAVTPNLDRLAQDACRFTNCFNQSPVCSPARHSINTGQYAHRHGVLHNHVFPYEGMTTIAHALAPAGYRCYHAGHMHWQGAQDNGYEPPCTEGWVGREEKDESWSAYARNRRAQENQFLIRVTTGGPGPRAPEQFGGHYVAQKTIEHIEEAVAAGQPFLAWGAFSEPHPPWYPPRAFYEMIDKDRITLPPPVPEGTRDEQGYVQLRARLWEHLTEYEIRQIIAAYYGLNALMDSYVGRVLDAVDRLGIADDTIVIWSSDHGDQLYENGCFLKFITREASVRVPLMIRIPGRSGGVRDELVEHVDLFGTLCDLAGVATPDAVQGETLTPLLGDAPAPEDWRTAVFSEIEAPGVREMTSKDGRGPRITMIRTADWKLNAHDGVPGELFDMRQDPGELHNLVDDPGHAETVAELHGRMGQWRERTAPPPDVMETRR